MSPFGQKSDKLQIEPIGALDLEANGPARVFFHFLTDIAGQFSAAVGTHPATALGMGFAADRFGRTGAG